MNKPKGIQRRTNKKVSKAMSTEEFAVLSNIDSLIQELISMGGGPVEDPEEMVMEAEDQDMDPDMETTNEEEEVDKGLESTPSEGPTASDDTEERIDEVETNITEETLQEVAKMLLPHLSKKTVAKSQRKDPMNELLTKLVEVQKSTQSQVSELSEAFSNILVGMGVADQLQVAKSKQKKDPVVSTDNEDVVNFIQGLITKSEDKKTEKPSGPNSNVVRKNLSNREVLAGMLHNRF